MRRVIFYSWQSDLPSRGNRGFINDALERAIRTIAADDDATLEPVLDRDTANLGGTPDIAHSILAKISAADVFVADVSIINAGSLRPSPNPNILVELGYAAAELGWENIILVQNIAFGGPELLPFDLRGRRVITYSLDSETAPAEARGLLQGRFEGALRSSLSPSVASGLPSGREAKLWWGVWRNRIGEILDQTLFVREVGPNGFLFDLSVSHGAHYGHITAYARVMSQDLAYCRLQNGPGQPDGELMFRRELTDGGRVVIIEEVSRCSYFGGTRAHFGGRLTHEYEPWFDAGCLNELEVARLYSLVGSHLSTMRLCSSDMGSHENTDAHLMDVRAYRGGVAGLYASMGSLLMVADDGRMWAAFTDDAVLRYFTNVPDYRARLPETIEEWRRTFGEIEVVYCEAVDVVPTRDI
ncbi:hypothetical protein N2A98_22865 [Pseudomonas sp. FJ2-5-13]|uniref:hypothetical protein n=1 Tax=Pseudomonas sp. FJ2-5-13 TaxID=2976884 RepID=UPI0023D7FC5F|nr:hypothetical protein [Pseudomonas sp. FJ2-5-13]WEJ04910.1 hypothetical protein N2A98_22865 [Pseudomonas sp. FJ2-5-13]